MDASLVIGEVDQEADGQEGRDLIITFADDPDTVDVDEASPSYVESVLYYLGFQADTAGTATYQVTLSDGDTRTTEVSTVVLTVSPPEPALGALDGDAPTGQVNAAINLDAGKNATISDPDSEFLDGGSLTLTRGAGGLAGSFRVDGVNVTSGYEGDADGLDEIVPGEDIAVGDTIIGVVDMVDDGQGGSDLTIALNGDEVSPEQVETLLHNLTFVSATAGTQAYAVTLSDGDDNLSDPATVTFTVQDGHPVLNNLDGDTPSGAMNAAIALDLGGNVTVTDSNSTTFNRGNLTIQRVDMDPDSAGVQGLSGSWRVDGTTVMAGKSGDLAAMAANENVYVNGVAIGVVDATRTGQSGADLVIKLTTDNATPARVETLIRNLSFVSTTAGTQGFNVTVTDNASQVSGTAAVSMAAAGTTPLVGFLDGDAGSGVVESPIPLDPEGDLIVADGDSVSFDGGVLTLSWGGAGSGQFAVDGDSVQLYSSDDGTIAAEDYLFVDEVMIGWVDGQSNGADGADLAIVLTDEATPQRLTTLLRSLNFITDQAGEYAFQLTVSDGTGNTSAVSAVTLTVQDPDPVVADLDGDVVFGDLDPNVDDPDLFDPLTVDLDRNGDATVTDPDTTHLGGLVLSVSTATAAGEGLGGSFSLSGTSVVAVSDLSPAQLADQAGASAIAGGEYIVVGGKVIGQVSTSRDGQEGSGLDITLNHNATPERVETLVRELRFTADETGSQSYDVALVVQEESAGYGGATLIQQPPAGPAGTFSFKSNVGANVYAGEGALFADNTIASGETIFVGELPDAVVAIGTVNVAESGDGTMDQPTLGITFNANATAEHIAFLEQNLEFKVAGENVDFIWAGVDAAPPESTPVSNTSTVTFSFIAEPLSLEDLDGDVSHGFAGAPLWFERFDGVFNQASLTLPEGSTLYDPETQTGAVLTIAEGEGGDLDGTFLVDGYALLSGQEQGYAPDTVVLPHPIAAGDTLFGWDLDAEVFIPIGSVGEKNGQNGNSLEITFNQNATDSLVGDLLYYLMFLSDGPGSQEYEVTITDAQGIGSAINTVTYQVFPTPTNLDGDQSPLMVNETIGMDVGQNFTMPTAEGLDLGDGTINFIGTDPALVGEGEGDPVWNFTADGTNLIVKEFYNGEWVVDTTNLIDTWDDLYVGDTLVGTAFRAEFEPIYEYSHLVHALGWEIEGDEEWNTRYPWIEIELEEGVSNDQIQTVLRNVGFSIDTVGDYGWEVLLGTAEYSYSPAQTVTFLVRDQRPEIDDLDGDNPAGFQGTPIALDAGGDVVVSDNDSTHFAGGSLTLLRVDMDEEAEGVQGLTGSFSADGTVVRNHFGGNAIGSYEGDEYIYVGDTMIGVLDAAQNGQNGNDILITLNEFATPALIQSLLRNLSFTSSEAGTQDYQVVLNDGGFDSLTSTVTFTVEGPVPVVSGLDGDAPASAFLGSQVAVDVGANATVTDADSNHFGGGVLTIAKGEGDLAGSFAVDGVNVVLGGEGGLSVGGTLIGSVDAILNGQAGADLVIALNDSATAEGVETLLHNLKFTSATKGSQAYTITLSDGDANNSNSSTVTFDFLGPEPRISGLNGDGDNGYVSSADTDTTLSLDATSGGSPAAAVADANSTHFKGGNLLLTRVDMDSEEAGVQGISGSFAMDGVFTRSGTNGEIAGGEVVYVDNTAIGVVHTTMNGQNGSDLLITFTSTNATPARVATLLNNLKFSSAERGTQEYSVTITDALNGNLSAASTVTFTVESPTPRLEGLDGDTPTGFMGQSVRMDAATTSGELVVVSDDDLYRQGGGADFNGGTLTLTKGDGTLSGSFGFGLSDSTVVSKLVDDTEGLATIAAEESFYVGGVAIGTVTVGKDGQGGNDLEIQLNANATAETVQTVVRSLTFRSDATGTQDYSVVLNDGDGNFTDGVFVDGGAGTGNASTAATVTFTVQGNPANLDGDAPTGFSHTPIRLDVGDPVTLPEGLPVGGGTLLLDPAGEGYGCSFQVDGSQVTLKNETVLAEEVETTIATLFIGETAIGTVDATRNGESGAELLITLADDATAEGVETLIGGLRLVAGPDGDADNDTYTYGVVLTNGQGNAAATATVTFTVVDPANVFSGIDGDTPAGNTNTPISLDAVDPLADPVVPAVSVTDGAASDLAGVTLTLTRALEGDLDGGNFSLGESALTASGAVTIGDTVIGSVDATRDGQSGRDLLITLSGNATPTLVETLLRTLALTADEPGSQAYTVALEDGDAEDPQAVATAFTVTFSVTRPEPVLANLHGDAPSGQTGSALALDSGANATVTDDDTLHFNGGNLTLTSGDGTLSGSFSVDGTTVQSRLEDDEAGFTALVANETLYVVEEGIPIAIGTVDADKTGQDGADLMITLNGDATPARVETLLHNLTFTSASAGTRAYGVTLTDGADGNSSSSATVTFTVSAPVTPPSSGGGGSSPPPSGGGGSSPPPSTPTPTEPPVTPPPSVPTGTTYDGVTITTQTTTSSGGTTTVITVPPVDGSRVEDSSSWNSSLADVPLAVNSTSGGNLITVSLPIGVGVTSTALSTDQSGGLLGQFTTMMGSVISNTQSFFGNAVNGAINTFVNGVTDPGQVTVRSVTLTGNNGGGSGGNPIIITGATGAGEGSKANPEQREALYIDASTLGGGSGGGSTGGGLGGPITGGGSGGGGAGVGSFAQGGSSPTSHSTKVQLNNVEFAVFVGAGAITGGQGANTLYCDDSSQYVVLGPEDDELHGGGGNDTVGSQGGDDLLYGDGGNDLVVGGEGNDTLEGGSGNDILQGGQGDGGTMAFHLGADHRLNFTFTSESSDLSGFSSLSIQGPWVDGQGQRAINDARFEFVYQDATILESITLLHRAVTGDLPTLETMNSLATLGMTPREYAELAGEVFMATQEGWTELDTGARLAALVDWVWGAGAATPEVLAQGEEYLASGGSWAEVLLFAVQDDQFRGSLSDGEGNISLVQEYQLSEAGWSSDTGSDTLRGGAGNDTLVGGRGSDLLDGGAGTDQARVLGNLADHLFELGSDGQLLLVHTLTGDVDTLVAMESVLFGDQSVSVTASNLSDGTLLDLALLQQLMTGSAPTLVELNAMVEQGVGMEGLALQLVSSEAWQLRYGTLSGDDFVTRLAQEVVGSPLDAATHQALVAGLSGDASYLDLLVQCVGVESWRAVQLSGEGLQLG